MVSGEIGILKAVHKRKVSPSQPESISLEMEYENCSYSGILNLKDPTLAETIYELLRQNLKKPIRDIGDIEIP